MYSMRIAGIGGGVTGLTAAYELGKRGRRVVLIEKEKTLGGLAHGFTRPDWEWHLEGAYHHLFTNDGSIIGLLRDLGLLENLIIRRPLTAVYWSGDTYRFDTPQSLLTFPGLSLVDKARTGVLLAFLKFNPFWKPLEGITAGDLLTHVGGMRAWSTIWEPLMVGKFGQYAQDVAASWFWARLR